MRFTQPDIAFLHTSAVHVPTFTALVARLQSQVIARHTVDEELLRDARIQGADAPDIVRRVHVAVQQAANTGARVVVCTCSTIGAAAEATPTSGRFVSMRIDRAMADRAAGLGPNVLVVVALQSTLEPTTGLIDDSARKLNLHVQVSELFVEGAWEHFESGDTNAYLAAIEAAIRAAVPGPGVIVLAQASMAGAAERLHDIQVPVLSSPELGVCAALEKAALQV